MANNKNKFGQYFTIESVAEFMISLISNGKTSKILEPSCGTGVFIRLLQDKGFENIVGYEIDPELSMDLESVKHESFVSSPLDEMYDTIIGNPPYIRWKNLESELKNELKDSNLWNQYFNSLCDYLFIFILKSIEQLNNNGELIFICPEYWMNTTHSKSLRNYIVENGHFSDIYHFKEAPLFEGVNSSFIIFRYVKANSGQRIRLHKYTKKGKPSLEELNSSTCFQKIEINQFKPNARWLLASEEELLSINQFENACLKNRNDLFNTAYLHIIGDYFDIGNGMVSGLDKAFRVENTETLNKQEKDYLIDVLKAKDLGQFYNKSESCYIYVKDSIDEDTFKRECPTLFNQLDLYRIELSKRYNYGRDLKFWEFAFPRNRTLFKKKAKRILVPCKERISHKKYFRFTLANENIFPLQDVTGILPKTNCREAIEYVLAFLNNERVFNWLIYNGIVKGEIVEFSETPLASIPYRPINWSNETEVFIHNDIVNNVKAYISSKEYIYVDQINNNFNLLLDGNN